ncbi:MAG: hypothetical protein RL385_3114 [Pseudomonadota bacterium]|jgi:Tfp pilus assembly protein FimT
MKSLMVSVLCVAMAAMTAITNSCGVTDRMRSQKPLALAMLIIVSASKARANAAPILLRWPLSTCRSWFGIWWYTSDTSQRPWALMYSRCESRNGPSASSLTANEFRRCNPRTIQGQIRLHPRSTLRAISADLQRDSLGSYV